MYLSADDARSDFFLAAAAYVIGPSLLALIARGIGIAGSSTGILIVAVIGPVLTTAAMPLYLLRYREQSFASLFGGGVRAFGIGAVAGAPFVVGVLAAEAVGGDFGFAPGPLVLLGLAVYGACQAILAVFLWRRAEYAFRPFSEPQRDLVRKAAVAAAATLGIATVLLLLDGRPPVTLLAALGLAAVLPVAERLLPQDGIGERWWVWATPLTLALGPLEIFGLFLGGGAFLASAQAAAGAAIFGLVVVMAMHRRLGGMAAFGLALSFTLADLIAVLGGGTGFFV